MLVNTDKATLNLKSETDQTEVKLTKFASLFKMKEMKTI